jgi:acetolactate synthase-1/2/3 large subunit
MAHLRAAYPLVMPGGDDPLQPYGIIRHTAARVPGDSIVTTDVGQHQMWAAQADPLTRPRQWLTSGGLGTMGSVCPRPSARRSPRPVARWCASAATEACS